ncbi:unnamed protein product [Adineta ricciae]|nr:unnamed protein product [Adineta ricciae]
MLKSARELECSTTKLENDTSRRSSELLAAVCYHHYHGEEESKAFAILEQRGTAFEDDEQDLISLLLRTLLKKQQSVCTVKGTVNALAGMKYEKLFGILPNLLPHDVNVFFLTDTPNALAKLGDRRAIPLLTDTIDRSVQEKDDHNDEKVKSYLRNGTKKKDIGKVCLAVATSEQQYFTELEKILTDGNTLDYVTIEYL